jgi:TRAP transporter TAXI family solute receptor
MELLRRKLLWALSAALIFLFPVNGVGAQWPRDLIVISPAPGTSVHALLTALGKLVVKYTPAEKWTVQPLGGPELWLPMMKQGKCQFANHSVPDTLKASLGRGLYDKMGPMPVRTVAAGHNYMFMFWTIPDTNIKNISDLKGKRVYLKYKNNPLFTEMAEKQLASAGLGFSDLKSVLPFSSLAEATNALMEGAADALLFPAVPKAVMEINQVKAECLFVALTPEQAQYVVERLAGYYLEDIPADDPRFGNKGPIPNAICYQNAMFCSPALDSEIVYGVVKAIFDHSNELTNAHPLAKYWSLAYRPVAPVVPYHEGAIRYFKEKGVWTHEAQMDQERAIKRQKKN